MRVQEPGPQGAQFLKAQGFDRRLSMNLNLLGRPARTVLDQLHRSPISLAIGLGRQQSGPGGAWESVTFRHGNSPRECSRATPTQIFG
jgi:hypothetical protein